MEFSDYSCAPGTDGKLRIYLELSNEKEIENARALQLGLIEHMMETELWRIPDLEYASRRKRSVRVPVEIRFVQPQTQLLLRDSRMRALDTGTDQMRPVHALLNPKHLALYESQQL